MRVIFGLSLLLTVAVSAWPQTADRDTSAHSQELQTGYCPQTHPLEAEPSQKFFLDGTIGKRHVRMYLDRGGSGVVGLFFDVGGDWETTLLGGTWNNGTIDASDASDDQPATGHLKASLANNRLRGTWAVSKSDHSELVNLATIPEPSCDGKEGWKRFDDSDWPVTFSSPSSWHVEKSDDDSVTITCPNPSEIASDQHIVIHGGTGAPNGPTHLVQCGKFWIYGDGCTCAEAGSHACPLAKMSRINSAVILDVSEQEHRIYCLKGGYVAAGDGEDRIILLRDRWLEINAPANTSEIMNRLIRSVALRNQK